MRWGLTRKLSDVFPATWAQMAISVTGGPEGGGVKGCSWVSASGIRSWCWISTLEFDDELVDPLSSSLTA